MLIQCSVPYLKQTWNQKASVSIYNTGITPASQFKQCSNNYVYIKIVSKYSNVSVLIAVFTFYNQKLIWNESLIKMHFKIYNSARQMPNGPM